jgi:hypothetical protein
MPLFSTLSFIQRLARLLGLLAALLAGSGAACSAQQLTFDLAYMSGDTHSSGENWTGALATDAQGNVYVGGYFAGTIYFGSQQFTSHISHYDIFVAKYNADGDLLWAQQAGLNGDERVRGLVVDAADNVYVSGTYVGTTQFGTQAPLLNAGSTDEDVFVAKLDAAGNWQWVVGAGGSSSDGASSLALAPGGQLVVGGYFASSTANFGTTQLLNSQPATASSTDIFVARLTTAGTWLSATKLGGAGSDALYDLATDTIGNTYVCGSFTGPQLQVGASTLVNASSSGTMDGFVAQLTAAGTWQWANRIGGSDQDMLLGLALDSSGRPYVAGSFRSATIALGSTTLTNAAAGTGDIVVAALDASGGWRWASRAGGPATDLGIGLAVQPTGQLTVAGQFYSRQLPVGTGSLTNSATTVGDGEAFVARLDAAGNWLTGLAPVGNGEKDVRRAVVAADGSVYLLGMYWGTSATFGEFILPGNVFFPNCYVAHVAEASSLARITSVAPATASAGQTVALTGTGFTNVQSVRFNGVPAASYTVSSATRLLAVVPAGTTSGPLRVRTAGGTSPGTPFVVASTLAGATANSAVAFQMWPNPLPGAAALHVQLPAQPLAGPTQAIIRSSLGQTLGQTTFGGADLTWNLHLPPGLYHLTLWPAGQPAWHQTLTVAE